MTFDEIIWRERIKKEARRIVQADPETTSPSLRKLAWKVLSGQALLIEIGGHDVRRSTAAT